MNKISPTDLAWVAGILEGEGYFGIIFQTKTYFSAKIECRMTDKDVIDRLHSIVGTGTRHIQDPLPPRKRIYVWHLTRRNEVRRLLTELLPLMGERRGQRIRDILLLFDLFPLTGRKKTGHTTKGDHVKICNSCRERRDKYNATYRAKRKPS